MKIETRLLSLDTSTSDTGWALYTNAQLTDYGSICIKNSDPDLRYDYMLKKIMHLLDSTNPRIVVIEKPPFKADPQALFKLSKLVGAVNGWCSAQPDFIDYIEYGPNEWRSFVKSSNEKIPIKRDLCKAWDLKKVKHIFPDLEVKNDNIADAILIGYARIVHFQTLLQKKYITIR